MQSYVKRHVRKSQSERRREIIDATLELLGEYGPEGTTISRIAAAVGVTPGALYRHFENRAALFAEANRLANERALSWIDTSAEPNVLRRLEELGERQAAWAKDNFNTVVRPFFLEIGSSHQPDIAGQMVVTRFKIYDALVDLAEEGKRQGSIRSDVDSADVAWCMLMFSWVQDIAALTGAEQSVASGAFIRNLRRMLDSFRVHRPSEVEN